MSRPECFTMLAVALVLCCAFGTNTASYMDNLPANCNEAIHLAGSKAKSGIYKIQLPLQYGYGKSFYVNCLLDPSGGATWTLIQLRQDEYTNFRRGWEEYKKGFGNLNRNFFIGLDKLHALTDSQLHELWIELKDFDNVTKYAKYDSFAIGDESQKYALSILDAFSGTAGDAMLGIHDGAKFSTYDRDNSGNASNCTKDYKGGWWYGKRVCHKCNLNGVYLKGVTKSKSNGVVWQPWHGYEYSLQYVHMAIRPKELRTKNRSANLY